MTLNSDAKFESTLTFWFPKWHSELGDLSLEHQEVWKLYIDGFFLSKAYNVSVRKFQRSYVSWHWRVLQGKLTCGLKNGIMNLVNFHVSSRKSENLHFNQILLSKAYKDLDEKAQKSYVSWHWRVMQSLKKNWVLVPKMTWGIWKEHEELCYSATFVNIKFQPKKYGTIISHDTGKWSKL